jgi:hypothetical protein
MSNTKEGPLEAFADGVGCLMIVLLPIAIFIGVPLLIGGMGMQFIMEENKKLQEERNVIEGVVSKVEPLIVEPPSDPPEDKEKKKGIVIKPAHVRERTKITFSDGRTKEFYGILSKPMLVDKYYIITYNGLNRVVDFWEKQ